MKKLRIFVAVLVTIVGINYAVAADKLNKYEDKMIDKVWLTTEALNQNNENIPSSNSAVNGFFGIAQYNADGTFKMYTQEGKLKLSGDWSLSDDGKSRTLVAKKPDGSIMFTRTVENITVEPETYTYRIYPEQNNNNVYYDIVHKPLSVILK
ncbi:uncharacterized protein DUF4822 [Orbus hercynius]|uniref:Uncharacterized protein DUF4822 n=1 Tax=Orbus hercynius TaxID=593135 RepID=A0A495RAX6_9GAMM|nr:DUF4822 domain-containing protein [Orbus hercynius]RKS84426.1 uncharacterized protein DUF4822 [Orbus hercynius]